MSAKIKKIQTSHSLHHPYRPRGIGHKAFHKVYWPYIPLLLMIGLVFSLGLRSGAFEAPLASTGNVLAYANSMDRSQLLEATNTSRSGSNSPELKENSLLDAAAQAKADDMTSKNYWSHQTPSGDQPWVFVTKQDYAYQKLGENLAAGFENEEAVVDGWMASTEHRKNLLDKDFEEVGFGVARSADYSAAGGGPMTLVVALYGKPSSAVAFTNTPVKGATSGSRTSHAQLAVASLPIAGLATNLAFFLIGAVLAIWVVKHTRSLRKALKKGENFALKHPLFDLGLVVLAAMSYLLIQTAGLIH